MQRSNITSQFNWGYFARNNFFGPFVGKEIRHINQILSIGFDRKVRRISLHIKKTKELSDLGMQFQILFSSTKTFERHHTLALNSSTYLVQEKFVSVIVTNCCGNSWRMPPSHPNGRICCSESVAFILFFIFELSRTHWPIKPLWGLSRHS